MKQTEMAQKLNLTKRLQKSSLGAGVIHEKLLA
jgi:hypothetical protein